MHARNSATRQKALSNVFGCSGASQIYVVLTSVEGMASWSFATSRQALSRKHCCPAMSSQRN